MKAICALSPRREPVREAQAVTALRPPSRPRSRAGSRIWSLSWPNRADCWTCAMPSWQRCRRNWGPALQRLWCRRLRRSPLPRKSLAPLQSRQRRRALRRLPPPNRQPPLRISPRSPQNRRSLLPSRWSKNRRVPGWTGSPTTGGYRRRWSSHCWAVWALLPGSADRAPMTASSADWSIPMWPTPVIPPPSCWACAAAMSLLWLRNPVSTNDRTSGPWRRQAAQSPLRPSHARASPATTPCRAKQPSIWIRAIRWPRPISTWPMVCTTRPPIWCESRWSANRIVAI